MEIPFEGEVSKSIVCETVKLDNDPLQKIVVWIFIKCLAVAVALLIVASGSQAVRLYAFLLIAVFLIDIWNLVKWKIRYIADIVNASETNCRGVISEQSIIMGRAGSKVEDDWSRFVYHKISINVVLLYDNKNRYLFFHRSWFKNDITWDGFVELIKSKTSPFVR